MKQEQTYMVEVLRFPEVVIVKATSKGEAKQKAKESVDFSVWAFENVEVE